MHSLMRRRLSPDAGRRGHGDREFEKNEMPVADRGHVGCVGLFYLFSLTCGRRSGRGRGLSEPGSQTRSRASAADRQSGMRRVPRRRRQQREPGESKPCGPARRLYYPAIDALPEWNSRQCGHAGHGGKADAGRNALARILFRKAKTQTLGSKRSGAGRRRTKDFPRRQCKQRIACLRLVSLPRWSRHSEAISAHGRPICRLQLGATEGVQGGGAWRRQGRQGCQRQSDGSNRFQDERARNAGGGGVRVGPALTKVHRGKRRSATSPFFFPSGFPLMAASIASLYVYPVKSCRGIALDTSPVGELGRAFDREWMVVDGDGRFVTQREVPRLALVEPSLTAAARGREAPGSGRLTRL